MTNTIQALTIIASNIQAQIESTVEVSDYAYNERNNMREQIALKSEAGLCTEKLRKLLDYSINENRELNGEIEGLRQALAIVNRAIRELEG